MFKTIPSIALKCCVMCRAVHKKAVTHLMGKIGTLATLHSGPSFGATGHKVSVDETAHVLETHTSYE